MDSNIVNELKNAKSVDDLVKIAKNSGLKLDVSQAEKIFKEIKNGGNVDIGGLLKSVMGGSKESGSTAAAQAEKTAEKTAGNAAQKTGENKSGDAGKAAADAIGSVLKKVIK